jgi:hypothetical protein
MWAFLITLFVMFVCIVVNCFIDRHSGEKEWNAAERKEWWDNELRPYRGTNQEDLIIRAVYQSRSAPWMQ